MTFTGATCPTCTRRSPRRSCPRTWGEATITRRSNIIAICIYASKATHFNDKNHAPRLKQTLLIFRGNGDLDNTAAVSAAKQLDEHYR